jgi:hypothetical protein
MNAKEIILPIYIFDLVFQAFLRIRELLPEVLVLLPNLLRGPLDKLVLPLDFQRARGGWGNGLIGARGGWGRNLIDGGGGVGIISFFMPTSTRLLDRESKWIKRRQKYSRSIQRFSELFGGMASLRQGMMPQASKCAVD